MIVAFPECSRIQKTAGIGKSVGTVLLEVLCYYGGQLLGFIFPNQPVGSVNKFKLCWIKL